MKANTLSINIYIYILVCLVCLTSSDKEGYFSISTSNKKWKFELNDSENAKKVADKLKKEGPMDFTFTYEEKGEVNTNIVEKRYIYYGHEFGFEGTETKTHFERYDIGGAHDDIDTFVFYVTGSIGPIPLVKIGNLIEGLDKLTEFDSFCEEGTSCTVTFTLAYTEVDDEKSKFPWLIILIFIFAALGIGIPLISLFLLI